MQAFREVGRVAGSIGAVTPEQPEGNPARLERAAQILDFLGDGALAGNGIAPGHEADVAQIFVTAAQLLRDRHPDAMTCALNVAAGFCIGSCREQDG